MKRMIMMLSAAILIVMSSCRHREFDYESNSAVWLDVVFDWENEPSLRPGSMALFLFPSTGEKPLRFDFSGHEGGSIKLAAGQYDAVCLNSDERDASLRGHTAFDTFEVTTSEKSTMNFSNYWQVRAHDLPRAPGCEDQPLVGSAPLLWSATVTSFSVATSSPSSAKKREANARLVMKPARIVDKFIVTVINISNLDGVQAMSATVSDMADGYIAAAGSPNDASVTIPLDLSISHGEASAEGTFMTFGHCSPSQRTHKLVIYAIMADGSKYYFQREVTDQVHSDPDEENVYHILVDGLEIPASGGGSAGGLLPDVGEWNHTDIGLEL